MTEADREAEVAALTVRVRRLEQANKDLRNLVQQAVEGQAGILRRVGEELSGLGNRLRLVEAAVVQGGLGAETRP